MNVVVPANVISLLVGGIFVALAVAAFFFFSAVYYSRKLSKLESKLAEIYAAVETERARMESITQTLRETVGDGPRILPVDTGFKN